MPRSSSECVLCSCSATFCFVFWSPFLAPLDFFFCAAPKEKKEHELACNYFVSLGVCLCLLSSTCFLTGRIRDHYRRCCSLISRSLFLGSWVFSRKGENREGERVCVKILMFFLSCLRGFFFFFESQDEFIVFCRTSFFCDFDCGKESSCFSQVVFLPVSASRSEKYFATQRTGKNTAKEKI